MLTKVITTDKFKFYVKLIGVEVVLVSKLCASRFFCGIFIVKSQTESDLQGREV